MIYLLDGTLAIFPLTCLKWFVAIWGFSLKSGNKYYIEYFWEELYLQYALLLEAHDTKKEKL